MIAIPRFGAARAARNDSVGPLQERGPATNVAGWPTIERR
jgi:hypothetical protein